MPSPSEPVDAGFSGQVRLVSEERPLGFVRMELSLDPDGRARRRTAADPVQPTWGGIIGGSDYLMWGANHTRLWIEFPDGTRSEVVIRATGRVLGIGPPPAVLTP